MMKCLGRAKVYQENAFVQPIDYGHIFLAKWVLPDRKIPMTERLSTALKGSAQLRLKAQHALREGRDLLDIAAMLERRNATPLISGTEDVGAARRSGRGSVARRALLEIPND